MYDILDAGNESYMIEKSGQHSAAARTKPPKAELVFGLVYPLGTEVSPVLDVFDEYIRHFGYAPHTIRISEYLSNFNLQLRTEPATEAERLIRLGNMSCEQARRKDFLALAAVSQISESRDRDEKNAESQPSYGVVHIIRSLKRPEEIFLLRQIYRPGLYIIGVFATEDERLEYLTKIKGYSDSEAKHLMKIDEAQAEDDYGQRNRKTFHLADVFVETKNGRYSSSLSGSLTCYSDSRSSLPPEMNMGCFWLQARQCVRPNSVGRSAQLF